MMGERTTEQAALFYEFSLERHVPADHLLRSIDRFVDLSGIREHLRPYYSEMGRPSVGPELIRAAPFKIERMSRTVEQRRRRLTYAAIGIQRADH